MLSERDVVSRGLTHNVSEGKQTLPQGQDQSHWCYLLVKTLSFFCSYPGNLVKPNSKVMN